MKKRWVLYAVVLSMAVGALAVNTIHVHGLERELQAIADDKIAEFMADEPEESRARLKLGASVVATKAYVVLGEASGKVSVYLQRSIGDEKHIEGFEFFFVRDDAGEWTQTDSGMCTSEECTQEGLRVLKALDAK